MWQINGRPVSPSERIAHDLAMYIGPNWKDYIPVSEMTTEFIHRFGTRQIGDVSEVSWVDFLLWCEKRNVNARTSR